MLTRTKIAARLDIQQQHEGNTDNIRLCRLILASAKRSAEWNAATRVAWHRYGPLSYQAHAFHYASDWLVSLLSAVKAESDNSE
jgi:hypothetical protein